MNDRIVEQWLSCLPQSCGRPDPKAIWIGPLVGILPVVDTE
jgi:hypothetical protein